MRLGQVTQLLQCEVLLEGRGLDADATSCLVSDMMSDVLAFSQPGALLVTGLTSLQSVRTAELTDAVAVLYVRSKRPSSQALVLAETLALPVLVTKLGMFDACGILYAAGLKGAC
jgi:predicted transcriptional regulator